MQNFSHLIFIFGRPFFFFFFSSPKVQSFGERIVLFILNVIIFGRLERKLDDDDMFFLPHSAKEQAKILWRDGAAVGFYTTKMKGKGHGAVWGRGPPPCQARGGSQDSPRNKYHCSERTFQHRKYH